MLGMVTSNTKRQQWLFADVGIAMALVAWWLYAQDVADFVLPDPLEVFLAGGACWFGTRKLWRMC